MKHYINIIYVLKLLSNIIYELYDFLFNYLSQVNYLEETGELEKLQIRTDYIKQLCFVVNMPTDILFLESSENEVLDFERSLVTQSMEKRGYTAFFSRQNLIETIKIRSMKRIKDNVYYAYLIKMWYNFRYLNFKNIINIIITTVIYYVLIVYLIKAEWVSNFINWIIEYFL